MATIGQSLPNPESGWRRYDDTVGSIDYTGTWGIDTNAGYYGGSYRASNIVDNKIQICFLGTKFRIIADYFTNKPKDVSITVDGVESTYSQYSTSAVQKALVYEKTGLNREYHIITITVKEPTVWTSFDAIDIDDDGELIRYNYLTSDWAEPMKKYGVASFGFDEASGNTIDKLGNGYVGTVTGATRVIGWNGEGSAMNGNTTSSTTVKFNAPVIPNGAKTIRFKLKVTSNKEGVVVTRTQGSAGNGLQIGLYNSYLYVNLYEKNTLIFGTGLSKILDLNKWYDIMFSWDGTTSTGAVKLYLNEELVSKTTAISNETAVSIHNMSVLGHYSATGFSFDGQLDDLQIYNKALSPSDFTQKRLVVKTTDNKNLVLSPTSTRVKEIPNTAEYMMLAQGGIVKEIDSAVDSQPIDFTKTTTEYEIVTNNKTPLGKGRIFTIPIDSDFKTAMIEDNY
ncbi:hypothetical protein B1B04_24845 [Lysinibacillus sp. KCTC 33748]|uniref:LamG domain-containing protein n=1 Tax=unclassified Lysinibacillus TaxID=2636778 RepID=UPI0009A6BC34|nr:MULTISPECIES: LamG domain-containing protein [unclassified Lysinibacillus]OXS65738.1 hypothetical protein B1B04_24845 [Lysinibacillus sp. KCTC 33748]SKC19327.1 Concanavalin A-like lectin/glucanases superfamily protein [Lysinibacillus sp. AC-3]